ncbi:MAG: cobyric acid synthase [Candidatus Omnitrophica bacterium]|nr:cobyric acid synthase [Candidatus Omnitrophota bacterium]
MKQSKAIQVCGTGSGVGKSVIVTALCRIFLQDGFKVCPFKAQNMALNSYVTKDGGEIGRAQATQAQAAKIAPSVDMNPILIKPTSDRKAQIIVKGRLVRNMSVYEYVNYKKKAQNIVLKSFRRLAEEYELVVIEGAGSPAEVNLKSHDIVNMSMAKHANAPVLLVGDIDKGGVFAWIVGTLELLTKEERKRIKGIVINKFRGDKRLLRPGIDFLEKKTGIKVLGVIPYFKDIKIAEEDSISLEKRDGGISNQKIQKEKQLDIAVISLPHISNFTDFDALENEPDVKLRYVSCESELGNPDAIIIPGTKSTVSDLNYLKKTGLAEKITLIVKNHSATYLVEICGGYQILGERINDRRATESARKSVKGLGILPVITSFGKEKILSCVKGKDIVSGLKVTGYEIHHGKTRLIKECKPAFRIFQRQGKKAKGLDGAISKDGRIWGTYFHGVFDEDNFRRSFLNKLRLKNGWPPLTMITNFSQDKEFDKLAGLVRENIDMDLLYKIIGLEP